MSEWKRLAIAAGGLLALHAPLSAADWHVSYTKALAEAKKTGKVVLADFTGSDWCGWCIKLHKEVFDTAEFEKWAKDNVVLLVLDFPQRKAQPASLTRQNERLKAKYGVRGYPTILFLDGEGEVMGRSGYVEGGAAAWLEEAKAILDSAKPPKIEPTGDYAKALAAAKEKKTPLLVLTYSSEAAAERTAFDTLCGDEALARLANARLTSVHVDTAGAASGNVKALGALRAKHKVAKAAAQTLLVDPAADKLLYSSDGAPKPAALLATIRKVLPPPKYAGEWVEDFNEARIIAIQLDRPVLMNFTGSDWGGWPERFDKEVLSAAEFRTFAKDKLVLVKLDFPRKKKLPKETARQNRILARKYAVRTAPTVELLSPEGKSKSRIHGYPEGGLKAFMAWLKEKAQ